MSTADDEEFLKRLSREFTAERWHAIYSEMDGVLKRFITDMGKDRAIQLVTAVREGLGPPRSDDEETMRAAQAWMQTYAEGVLAAVAHYFATTEKPES